MHFHRFPSRADQLKDGETKRQIRVAAATSRRHGCFAYPRLAPPITQNPGEYVDELKRHGLQVSVACADNPCENARMESLFKTLNYDDLSKQEREQVSQAPCCKLCGQPLPPEPEGKTGRPKEYCQQCQPLRAAERHKRFRGKKRPVSIVLQ